MSKSPEEAAHELFKQALGVTASHLCRNDPGTCYKDRKQSRDEIFSC